MDIRRFGKREYYESSNERTETPGSKTLVASGVQNFNSLILLNVDLSEWFLQGFLSFMSAPLIGALSDVWGRKSFLLVTVFFTCVPIPLMKISPWWYFAMISVSGIFSVTFSVIFAYVADITQEHERSTAYGLA
ncbi:UNVERIFIED_CONTAM: Hippocampus abundant transcript 1 protein [Gekko kuhli]